MFYFDHNATTPLFHCAQQAWLLAQEQAWMNPSSPYRQAAAVHARLNAARGRLADLMAIDAERIVFNSGASEGNHAIFGHLAATLPAGSCVGISPTEHASLQAAAELFFPGRIILLALDHTGRVDRTALRKQLIAGELAAVSVMAANNETGIVNLWQQIAQDCRECGCLYHCDAAQWVGKMPLAGLGDSDFVTASAHKFGGPKGVGFLVLPSAVDFHASIRGGQQEGGRRAGTEDVPAIIAMVAALEHANAALAAAASVELPSLAEWQAAVPGIQVVGGTAQDLWNTRCVIMPDYASVRWVRALERRQWICGTGAACSGSSVGQAGHSVLEHLGYSMAQRDRMLRFSSGWQTSVQDWRALLAALAAVYAELQEQAEHSLSAVLRL
jgi:cysteine desulfurase